MRHNVASSTYEEQEMKTIEEFRALRQSYDLDINTINLQKMKDFLDFLPADLAGLVERGISKVHVYPLKSPNGFEFRLVLLQGVTPNGDRFEADWDATGHPTSAGRWRQIENAEAYLFKRYRIASP
jgi:hypothetical protein